MFTRFCCHHYEGRFTIIIIIMHYFIIYQSKKNNLIGNFNYYKPFDKLEKGLRHPSENVNLSLRTSVN